MRSTGFVTAIVFRKFANATKEEHHWSVIRSQEPILTSSPNARAAETINRLIHVVRNSAAHFNGR